MRILFLIYSLGGGGAERVTTVLANVWAKAGHTVEIAVLDGRSPAHYPLDPEVTVTDLRLADSSSNPLMALAKLARRVLAIRRHLARTRPDAAIGMMTTSAVLLALARVGLNVRAIGSERVYPPAYPLPAVWTALRRWTFGLLDTVVVQTQATRAWVEQHTRAGRIAVIANPVMRVSSAALSESAHKPKGSHVILGAGRLVHQKGFHRLVDAFTRIAATNPDWDLVILGEGPLREDLTRQAADSGFAARIHLPGNVADIGAYYDAADIFVLPSYFEGMPNALLEAMAHGLPSIAFDIESGTREFVSDGHDGLLVPDGDPQSLSKALQLLISDASLRARIGAAAKCSSEAYSPEAIADRWLAAAFDGRGVPAAEARK